MQYLHMVFPANGAILFFSMQSIMGWRTTHPGYYLLRSIMVLNTCGQVFLVSFSSVLLIQKVS